MACTYCEGNLTEKLCDYNLQWVKIPSRGSKAPQYSKLLHVTEVRVKQPSLMRTRPPPSPRPKHLATFPFCCSLLLASFHAAPQLTECLEQAKGPESLSFTAKNMISLSDLLGSD